MPTTGTALLLDRPAAMRINHLVNLAHDAV
jgi:hypothetical protein